MGLGHGHGRHTKVDTVCSMAWAREARKFGVGRAKRENLGGVARSAPPGDGVHCVLVRAKRACMKMC